MTRLTIGRTALLALALWCAGAAPAAETTVRVGDHPGFGRLVFELPVGARFDLVTEGDRVLVVFQGAGAVPQPAAVPRNVVSVRTGPDTATLMLAPGAHARPLRMGNRLVLDVFDPAARRTRTPPEPAPPPKDGPREAASITAPVPEPAHEIEAVPVTPAPVAPVIQEALAPPAAIPPTTAPPTTAPPPAFLLRTDADVGAAAFRRGDLGLIVLDRRIAAPPAPGGGVWEPGAVSMTLRLPVPADAAIAMSRVPEGWSVTMGAAAVPGSLQPVVTADGIGLPLPRPGRVVAILDPVTGGTLLVGTSLAAGPEAAVPEPRRTPDYTLLPTWLGVAIEPAADRIDLRPTRAGFGLTGGAPGPAIPPATTLSRRFDLPDQPPPALLNRLRAQLAAAAAAPPRARSTDRIAAAQSMIALGLGAEAQALMQLVAAEDPRAAADAETPALAAMAAVLAGRLSEADALDDPRLDGTDEIALWRGLRDRLMGRDTPSARNLGTMAALALAYPATLQRLVWPGVAEAAVDAGNPAPQDRLPPYARARQLERAGQAADALAAYDALGNGPDRLDQVRAAAQAVELRLSAGQLPPADAAAVLERLSFAWRGDAREAGLRLRAAALRGVAGEWRPALEAFRGIEAQFPTERATVQAGKARVMEAMLAAAGRGMSPLDLVLLAAEYPDAVPEGAEGGAMARLLAEKLMVLDLPYRATPVLQGLMRAAPAGPARAEFGSRLAAMLLDAGDVAGATTALDVSAAPDLPPALAEARGLSTARLRAAHGDLPGAVSGLAAMGTEAADDLRAGLLSTAGDWPGALSALTDLAARRVPAEGPLSDAAQDILVRQASAAARAGDGTVLRMLERSAARMTGARADVFRVLTAAPLLTAEDLPRAARELALARLVPQRGQATSRR